MHKTTTQSGLSAIELIVILAIVALLVVIGGLPFLKFRQQQALQNTTNAVVSLLNEARTKAIAGYDNTSYSVRVEQQQAIVFTGTTYSAGASTNQIVLFESPITGPSTPVTFSFARMKGTTSSGTLTMSIPNGATRTITVTTTGAITRN